MTMTRKQFLRTLVGAGIGAAGVVAIASCSGSDGGSGPDAAGTCTTPNTAIGSNHGHVMMVALADVTARAAKSYDIMGTSLHTHTVMVSAADFAKLSTGGTVTLTSSSASSHSHSVTVMCA